MKLIPLSDFVLEQKKRLEKSGWQSTVVNSLELIFNYTEFLKQPLIKEMFTGKNRFFEGFELYIFKDGDLTGYVKHDKSGEVYPFPNHRNIAVEELVSLDVKLTPSALKAIGINE